MSTAWSHTFSGVWEQKFTLKPERNPLSLIISLSLSVPHLKGRWTQKVGQRVCRRIQGPRPLRCGLCHCLIDRSRDEGLSSPEVRLGWRGLQHSRVEHVRPWPWTWADGESASQVLEVICIECWFSILRNIPERVFVFLFFLSSRSDAIFCRTAQFGQKWF